MGEPEKQASPGSASAERGSIVKDVSRRAEVRLCTRGPDPILGNGTLDCWIWIVFRCRFHGIEDGVDGGNAR